MCGASLRLSSSVSCFSSRFPSTVIENRVVAVDSRIATKLGAPERYVSYTAEHCNIDFEPNEKINYESNIAKTKIVVN